MNHGDQDGQASSSSAPGDEWREAVEDRLRDAAYTAVGVGLFAYKYSEPRVRQVLASAQRWREDHQPNETVGRLVQDVEKAVEPVVTWVQDKAREGRDQTGRSRQ